LAILSKDFSPRPIASNTIKWLGLSLILTLDISLVMCTKQNLNSILRGSVSSRTMADNNSYKSGVLILK
jgi:hypothetical protein